MQPPLDLDIEGDWSLGAGYAVLSSFIFASMAVITRKFIKLIDPTRVNALRMVFCIAMVSNL